MQLIINIIQQLLNNDYPTYRLRTLPNPRLQYCHVDGIANLELYHPSGFKHLLTIHNNTLIIQTTNHTLHKIDIAHPTSIQELKHYITQWNTTLNNHQYIYQQIQDRIKNTQQATHTSHIFIYKETPKQPTLVEHITTKWNQYTTTITANKNQITIDPNSYHRPKTIPHKNPLQAMTQILKQPPNETHVSKITITQLN